MQTGMRKPIALNEWTYSHIKERILNLDFKPGEKINIDEFVEKLGISRTPIRDALLRLSNENLIDVKPRVGYFVSQITEQDIRDIFEIRQIIETRAIKSVIENLPDSEILSIQNLILDCQSEIEKSGDLHHFVEVDIQFHTLIHRQMENRLLSKFMQDMNDLTYRIRVISLQSEENIKLSINEHLKVVKALLERDQIEAENCIVDHLVKTTERMISIVRGVYEA